MPSRSAARVSASLLLLLCPAGCHRSDAAAEHTRPTPSANVANLAPAATPARSEAEVKDATVAIADTDDGLLVTDPDAREAAVGKRVTLRGVVERSKIATLVGVDVRSDSPDLRGHEAVATGVLEKTVVTQAEIDAEVARHGQFPNRGPGVFYRLVAETKGGLAEVHRP